MRQPTAWPAAGNDPHGVGFCFIPVGLTAVDLADADLEDLEALDALEVGFFRCAAVRCPELVDAGT